MGEIDKPQLILVSSPYYSPMGLFGDLSYLLGFQIGESPAGAGVDAGAAGV